MVKIPLKYSRSNNEKLKLRTVRSKLVCFMAEAIAWSSILAHSPNKSLLDADAIRSLKNYSATFNTNCTNFNDIMCIKLQTIHSHTVRYML